MSTQQTSLLFDYRTRGRIRGHVEGVHKSRTQGCGTDFYRLQDFMSSPDPRRVDLEKSILDPFESIYIRQFRQQSRLDVRIFSDISGSMLFRNKTELRQKIETSITASVKVAGDRLQAYKIGDACCRTDEPELMDSSEALREPVDQSSSAFSHLQHCLPEKNGLIFLLSDFYWPVDLLERVVQQTSQHLLVPIVICCTLEKSFYKPWRFIHFQDLETRQKKVIFTTPSQINRIREGFEQRDRALRHYFFEHNIRPVYIVDDYSPRTMSEYFNA